MAGPSLLEAVVQILEEAGTPLHAREIVRLLVEKNLWRTKSKVPHQTLAARLYEEIKRNGKKSILRLSAPRTFTLSSRKETTPGRQQKEDPTEAVSVRPTTATFSFTDSAEKVLSQFGNKHALHYREITKLALQKNWLKTKGQTPAATMYAQILTEIRRYQKHGEQPRFVQEGKGFVSLSRGNAQGLDLEIEQHNREVRKVLHQRP